MKLFQYLKKTATIMNSWSGCWALCGGIAASLYRDTPRYTGDLDLAVVSNADCTAREIAENVIKKLGYKPIIGFIAMADEKYIAEGPTLIAGRESDESSYIGVDILLPSVFWVQIAVERAQANLIDYGFAKLPTITVEDLFLAKLYAVINSPDRPYDRDDIVSIARNCNNFDRHYFLSKLKEFDLNIPESLQECLGKLLYTNQE